MSAPQRRGRIYPRHAGTNDPVPPTTLPPLTMVVSVRHLPVLPYAHAVARKIVLYCGDITKLEVDAIVNAANPTLLGGGGVDGAIHRAADHPEFLAECRRLGGCRTGEAKTTNAYRLPCKSVIHTVGPVYSEHSPSEARRLLQSAYRHSLLEAVRHQLRTVAFPSISTGVYGYPKEDATKAALEEVTTFLASEAGSALHLVVFCCFSEHDLAVYQRTAPIFFGAAL